MQIGNFSKLSPREEEILDNLKKEQYAGGAKYDSLRVVYFQQGYRGVLTTQQIKKGEIIVFIPKKHLITLQMAKQDAICQQLISNKVQVISPKHTYLAIFLLQEYIKQNDSFWKFYIDLLPKDPKQNSIFPINYSNQELSQLIGSPFLMQIYQKVNDLKRDYDKIFAISEQFRKYKFRDFCWARNIVGSRMFGLLMNGVKTDILAPFADMLNHKLPKQTSWNYIDEKQGFVIESLEDIPKGVQIFDSYGRKCNSRYLLNYGFVIENNPENQCLKTSINGDLKTKKLQMVKRPEGLIKILKMSAQLSQNNFYEGMGFLRFKVINDFNHLAVLEKISGIKITNDAYVTTKTPPINIDIQIKVWQELRILCENALKEYSTLLEQDLQMLKSQQLSNNLRNILILRSGEKVVLNKLIQYSNSVISILKKGYKQACQYLEEHQDEPWSKYLIKIFSIMPGQKSKILVSKVISEPEVEESGQSDEEQLTNI